ncbi:hypothetical protein [Laceyella tengchongensis]|uniref:hypothetical protein n=1 Tax=Laceyella tengchongensis TaxID=574699 RepID=UPI0012B74CBC|nr:hypothetical protein [Laceyella tengchongensis]
MGITLSGLGMRAHLVRVDASFQSGGLSKHMRWNRVWMWSRKTKALHDLLDQFIYGSD